jgi:RNA polymerase sigma-70 factor, ECF subfamily
MAVQAMAGEAILSNAITGKTASVETVESMVAQHMTMVFRVAWSILRNHHDAEDAVQETFLKVFKFGDRLHEIENPKTWLARIAWTTALDRRSRRSVIPGARANYDVAGEELLARLPDATIPLEQRLAAQEMQQLLERLIAGLPDDLRQPLELSTVQELNSTEIAEVMKIPAQSVRTRLMRARQLLKAKLESVLEVKKHGG